MSENRKDGDDDVLKRLVCPRPEDVRLTVRGGKKQENIHADYLISIYLSL